MEVSKAIGVPLLDGWTSGLDLPHSITTAVTYRARIDSLNELSKDKRPPRNLWDKPYRLSLFLDEIFDRGGRKKNNPTNYIDINEEDVE